MDAHGSLWIADFGLAHVRGNTQLTLTGEFAGTLRYASPEQPMARRVPVDQRTDVYSLGATLYELLTLQPVFDGKDHKELLRQILFDDPRPPQKLNRHVPRDLETIVLTALAKAPAHRYASAKEMAEDLHRFLNDQPIKARPEGALRWLWRKSRRYAASIALAVSAVVTAVVLLLFLLHLNKPSPEEVDRKRMQKALATHVQDLEQKKKVILIEGRGEPGYYKWRTDEKLGKILPAQDGAFSVQNWEYGLVELLPDPRLERYRFSVEVRHERQANQESRVGLYFAHSAHPAGESVAHFHYNVAFNDLVDVGAPAANGVHRGNAVGLQIHRQAPVGLADIDKFYCSNSVAFFPPAKPVGALGPWRRIAVEVRPKSITLIWEGNRKTTTPRDKMTAIGENWLISRPERPPLTTKPQFAPRDGLGLCVSLGVASFRNVTVEPLNDVN